MSGADKETPKRESGFLLRVLISVVVFNAGAVISHAAPWTDRGAGLGSGLMHLPFFVIMSLFLLLPWSLVVEGVCMWRKWRRFRTHVLLAPAVLSLLSGMVPLFLPHDPGARFFRFSGVELPAECRELQYGFVGGGFRDYEDVYAFETSRVEVERLVRELELESDTAFGHDGFFLERPRDGFPDFRAWPGVVRYKRFDEKTGWFYNVIADETHTKVYVFMGCI